MVKLWKFIGKNAKIYDNELKSYIHVLNVGALSKMQIPINEKSSLNCVFKSDFISVKYPSSESDSKNKLTYAFISFKGIYYAIMRAANYQSPDTIFTHT